MREATDEEILLDLELDLAVRGDPIQQCPKCEGWTYQKSCPCSPDSPLDPFEALVAREKAGEEVPWEEYERLQYPGKSVKQSA